MVRPVASEMLAAKLGSGAASVAAMPPSSVRRSIFIRSTHLFVHVSRLHPIPDIEAAESDGNKAALYQVSQFYAAWQDAQLYRVNGGFRPVSTAIFVKALAVPAEKPQRSCGATSRRARSSSLRW